MISGTSGYKLVLSPNKEFNSKNCMLWFILVFICSEFCVLQFLCFLFVTASFESLGTMFAQVNSPLFREEETKVWVLVHGSVAVFRRLCTTFF